MMDAFGCLDDPTPECWASAAPARSCLVREVDDTSGLCRQHHEEITQRSRPFHCTPKLVGSASQLRDQMKHVDDAPTVGNLVA